MTENNELVDISYASNLLGVSKLTLRNWDNAGTLKAVRVGNREDRRYRKADLERFSQKYKNSVEPVDRLALEKYIKNNTFWMESCPALPFTADVCVIEMANLGNYFKPGLSFCTFMYQKDYTTQILSIEESIAHCKSQFKALNDNPEKVHAVMQECEEIYLKFEKFLARLDFIELKILSQQEILREFENFSKMLGEFWAVSLLVEPYSPFLDKVYFPYFEKIVGDTQKAKEAFAVLTLPLEQSFVARERVNLLKIIIKFLQNTKERKILLDKSSGEYLADIKFRNNAFFKELEEHQQRYYWIQNNYGQHIYLTITDFLKFIKEILHEGDVSKLIEELERLENQEELSKNQEKIVNDLDLSGKVVRELEHIRHMTWIKDERKKTVLMMLHHLFNILDEFGRRTNIDPKVVAYATTEEIPKLLENNFDTSILNQRREHSFWIAQSGNKRSVFTGNDAAILRNKLIKEESNEKKEIHGNVACRGEESIITGTVRIILDPKDQTISKDEILITSMTRPDFVPLMRKAKAVVTDEVGITCHAAIVSREMNKPCIIGTHNATRTFHTGDEVELRMNHGTIKLLNFA